MSRRSSYYLGGRRKLYPVGSDCLLYHDYGLGDAVDHSIYGNDGTVVGATFVENGLQFDGIDNRVTITPTGVIRVHSIYLWMYRDSSKAGNAQVAIGYNGAQYYFYGPYDVPPEKMLFNTPYSGFATTVPVNQWCLFVRTCDGDQNPISCSYYENAVAIDSPQTNPNILDPQFDSIGAYNNAGSAGHKGFIGEVLIFNTVKSSDDITAYFNATKARYGVA